MHILKYTHTITHIHIKRQRWWNETNQNYICIWLHQHGDTQYAIHSSNYFFVGHRWFGEWKPPKNVHIHNKTYKYTFIYKNMCVIFFLLRIFGFSPNFWFLQFFFISFFFTILFAWNKVQNWYAFKWFRIVFMKKSHKWSHMHHPKICIHYTQIHHIYTIGNWTNVNRFSHKWPISSDSPNIKRKLLEKKNNQTNSTFNTVYIDSLWNTFFTQNKTKKKTAI